MGIPTVTLKGIKDETCPTCGARVAMIEQINKHCSGEWNEYVRYSCGAIQHYSPNFKRVMTKHRCPKHPISRTISAVDKGLKERLFTSIGKTIKETSLPAEDDHLLRELQEALTNIRNDLYDQVHLAIKRHLY